MKEPRTTRHSCASVTLQVVGLQTLSVMLHHHQHPLPLRVWILLKSTLHVLLEFTWHAETTAVKAVWHNVLLLHEHETTHSPDLDGSQHFASL